jgi:hypothetical protein
MVDILGIWNGEGRISHWPITTFSFLENGLQTHPQSINRNDRIKYSCRMDLPFAAAIRTKSFVASGLRRLVGIKLGLAC